MTDILTVNANKLIYRAGDELKKQKLVQPTSWSIFVKTGHHQERLPDSPDWWYVRAGAILRSIAKLGPVGTEKLRTKYGGKKNRGHQPEHRYKASGSIIRKILQQLEKSLLIKQVARGDHKGRVLTPQGVAFMNKIATQIKAEK
ncbi:MAG: small subunit ribosomal protein S19e [archaeon GW2011_AR9]|nr:MAG: small subunit ribosomal protein S19e [archaeon GW2011_AR9]MBS3120623.1 30S ribosomal protein S19e [Candidatus Woesearchaeota archaeon]HIG93530.1 30S ribosomal protein S19e [Candidatus Woesearchaeota archaeon]HIH13041.1 30S ribosomal protein S19e [Candidatus Woesearchaeota archaeon]